MSMMTIEISSIRTSDKTTSTNNIKMNMIVRMTPRRRYSVICHPLIRKKAARALISTPKKTRWLIKS